MSSTLTPTCSLCGLRFENRPILELHVREDHPKHGSTAGSGHGMPDDAPAHRPHLYSPASGIPERATDPSTKAVALCPPPCLRGRAVHVSGVKQEAATGMLSGGGLGSCAVRVTRAGVLPRGGWR
jgi:hypothetical protein